MSKNAVYTKPNYNNPSISIRDREKSMSISPHKISTQAKRTFVPTPTKNQDLQTTEAKRYRQNEEQYTDYRHVNQQRTNKKPIYPTAHQSSTGYSNNIYQAPVNNGKIDLLKEQNLYLSEENVHLNELVLEKNKIIATLQKKFDYQILQEVTTLEQIEKQKNKFLNQFHARDDEQRIQIQKLLIELEHANETISRISLEKKQILLQRDREVVLLKTGFTEQNRHLIDNVICKKDSELKSLELKLNECEALLDQMNVELRTERESAKMTETHLNEQLNRVLQQLQQVNHDKKIQISQQKIAFDNIILTMNKEKEQQISSLIFKYDVEIKKYKNQIKEQMLTNSNLQNLLESARLQHTDEVQKRLNEETQLKHHMHEMKVFYQQKEQDEMKKEKELNFQEHEMLMKAMELKHQEYEEDLKKLISVNKQNKAEIERLYGQIEKLRDEKKDEVQRVQKLNMQLRQRISELSQIYEENSEALKVKLGQLRHSDITTLKQFYENELALKHQEIMDLEEVVKENREKLHKELEEKVIQRKHHEREVDELRIKIAELELRIASIVQENKEKMNTMGSQIQMTSLTLIQETTQKEKYSKQTETQRKNLHEIINKKDEEIQELNSKMVLIKRSHAEEITEKQQTITILQEKSEQLNDEIRRQREFYQKEIYKKEQAKKETKEFYEMEIQKEKQTYSKEFTETTQKLMKEKTELLIQIEHMVLVQKQLKEELSMYSEHQEQRALEKEVSFNEEKARLEYAKENAEIGMKKYYEKKVLDIQEELNATKQQLAEKNQDIRNLNEKNYKLENKLEKLVESQEKMRVLQERVMAMGQQNNIVKNIAELGNTKSRRKAL